VTESRADRCKSLIDSWKSETSSLIERWDELQSVYDMDNFKRSFTPFEGCASFGTSILKELVDSLASNITNAIGSATPTFSAKTQNDQDGRDAEQCVQFVLDRCNFDSQLRLATQIACITGRVIFHVKDADVVRGFYAARPNIQVYENDDDHLASIPAIEVIHPRDFLVYPTTCDNLDRAAAVGHRIPVRVREVKEIVKAEKSSIDINDIDGMVISSLYTNGDTGVARATINIDDEVVDLWYMLVKDQSGEYEKWVSVLYAENVGIISEKEYTWSRPWYFAPSLSTSYRRFYPANSPAYSVLGIANQYNECANLEADIALMSVFPVVFGDKSVAFDTDKIELKPFQINWVEGGANLEKFPMMESPAALIQLRDSLKVDARAAFGVSQLQVGQGLKADTSATEASQIAQNANVSINDYVQMFGGSDLQSMASFIHEIVTKNFDVIKSVYQDSFPAESVDTLIVKPNWEVTGKSPYTNGVYIAEAIRKAVEFAGQTGQGAMIDAEQALKSYIKALNLPDGVELLKSQSQLQNELQQASMGAMPPGADGAGNPIPAGANQTLEQLLGISGPNQSY